MSIRQRGKSWVVDIKDINGKRIRKTYKTKNEAKLALSEMQINKAKGFSNVVNESLTMKQACEYFINIYAKLHCKAKTFDEYERIINKEIIPVLGDTKLIQLTKMQIEYFIKNLTDKGLSNATINKYITLIGSIIERQIENGNIYQNVAKKIKKLSNNSQEARALTPNEISIVLDTCKKIKPAFYPMLYTAVKTGLRRGELIALMWENIDFERNTILVKYSEDRGVLTNPKTQYSIRYVDMVDSVKQILLEQKMRFGSTSKFVFPNSDGNMYIGNNVAKRLFIPVMKACNIGHFRFHDLRHTYATQLIENKCNPRYVQEQLGHSSSSITLGIYTHSQDESREYAKTIIENLDKVA